MSQKQAEQAMKLMDRCMQMSAECEREIIAMREDGQAGIARVAPNCLMLAEAFFGGDMVFDFHLN